MAEISGKYEDIASSLKIKEGWEPEPALHSGVLDIGIMTCARPNGENYLPATQESLRTVFCGTHIIAYDGKAPVGSDRTMGTVRTGIVPTFRRLMHIMLEHEITKDNPVAIFQDDVIVTPGVNLGVIVGKELPSERGVFSLYLSEGRTAPQGWSTIDKSDEYPLNVGACGIVMDAETARLFIESPPFPRVDRLGSQLVQWCWREKIPFYVHSPSLLVHTGKVSCG